MTAQVTIREMTAIERDAYAPLAARMQVLLAQIQSCQDEVAIIEVALNGMAVMMHGERSENIGIEFESFTLYGPEKPKK